MAIRSVSSADYNLYSSSADQAAINQEMATILYIVGLDGSAPHLYEIDDVVQAIHEHFFFDTNLGAVVVTAKPDKEVLLAHEPFMRKHSHMLKVESRRLYRWLKLANGADENA